MMDGELREIISTFTNENSISWYTIPPRVPHFGRLWKVAVKFLKRLFYRTVEKTRLQLHQFLAILAQIEAILISRPNFTPSNDVNSALALTPDSFQTGRLLTAMPSSTHDKKVSLNRPSKAINTVVRKFWSRWKDEYLTSLQFDIKEIVSDRGQHPAFDMSNGFRHYIFRWQRQHHPRSANQNPNMTIQPKSQQICTVAFRKQMTDYITFLHSGHNSKTSCTH